MRVRKAGLDISNSDTQQQHKKFTSEPGHVVSRLYWVTPNELERFYFRALILHINGALTFVKIRRVNDIECCSFREACKERGPLAHETEWE